MKRMKYATGLALTAAIIATLVAGCGTAGSSAEQNTTGQATTCTTGNDRKPLSSDAGSITIGSANFPESELLAALYGQAMASRGVTVHYRLDIGARATYFTALEQGSIGMVPEYTGAILNHLNPANKLRDPQQVYRALRNKAACQKLTVTQMAAAEDVDTVTVTRATAAKYHLTSLADLSKVASRLTLGAAPEFRDSLNGTAGLKRDYNITFGRFVSLSPSGSITQTALRKGTVDAADIFSTDPSIAKYKYVQLPDPKRTFGAENVVPLFREDALTRPMAEAANQVSSTLTTQDLVALNAEVAAGKQPRDVARTWLATNGITG